jgi:hypothetical protein
MLTNCAERSCFPGASSCRAGQDITRVMARCRLRLPLDRDQPVSSYVAFLRSILSGLFLLTTHTKVLQLIVHMRATYSTIRFSLFWSFKTGLKRPISWYVSSKWESYLEPTTKCNRKNGSNGKVSNLYSRGVRFEYRMRCSVVSLSLFWRVTTQYL